ncbi:hypothetical protein DES38_11141 [Streptohalobacillus salinus]|uniref:Sodium:proton antiporter n=1 Tax=Streptohalobacillus salinus TaxID=621096 RepID=A0A2V3WA19_9BACI|nr:Na+/H+ antiporter NhaC family protein [Streptohalobacillus salinus]PXW88995.1 hypothetical protein DES38_11141 [Streptohalobacillus salinus]
MLEWIVIVSVLSLLLFSLLRVHVLISLVISSLIAGLMAGLDLITALDRMVEGMGNQAGTALSYILLGAFAIAISRTGITDVLVQVLIKHLSGKRITLVLSIAGIASLSQNLVPVHIAFIPLLIPPLLKVFDQMKIDRRAVASALTFGLKAPYIMIPAGYGLMFHESIQEAMQSNGLFMERTSVSLALIIPGVGMIVGLLIAVLISYRSPRDLHQLGEVPEEALEHDTPVTFNRQHAATMAIIVFALVVQIVSGQLIIGALSGLILMFAFKVVPFRDGEQVVSDGIKVMGTIAMIMLVAAGFSEVLKSTGAVDALIETTEPLLGNQKLVTAFIMLLVGLLITIGIGSSFATVPILAALYVPIGLVSGFSPLAIAALIGTAAALGDAGSPVSDSTLGPTSGLNADGKHHHIFDTCVPTFMHYNIPLVIFGVIAALVL